LSTAVASRSIHIFIHTGEVSGDLQGALLVEALKRQAQHQGYTLTISALGGERMQKAGAELIGNTVAVSAIGVFESWPLALAAWQLERKAQQHLQQNPPDLVVLIDYMGPNIAIGNFIRKTLPKVPIAYYIAPQQWVWSLTPNDTRRILRVADKVLAIFPEEARYYQKHSPHVEFVGHPLVDTAPNQADLPACRQRARARFGLSEAETVVTLMPASRQQELTYILPSMFAAAKRIQDRFQAEGKAIQFLVPVSRLAFREKLAGAVAQYGLSAQLVETDTQEAIVCADLALTKSGTANLEIALMNVPQVVLYRLSRLTGWLFQYVLRFSAPFVSPVNLIEMKPIVPEFLQWQATPEALSDAALALLLEHQKRQAMLQGYSQMRRALGEKGVCDRAATTILTMLP
jgi:lipid-A-disaccharide synthase